MAVVDDFVALAVIAVAYSEHISWTPLLVGAGMLVVTAVVRRAGVRRGGSYAVLGIVAWVAFLHSGVDPVVVGLIIGLLAFAYPAPRDALERATGLFRSFREQPTADLEREARIGIASALSPNDRLQRLWHPWSSYVIVPLFALANAGIEIDGSLLSRAFTSPITLGILLAYGLGKPIGIVGSTALATRLSRGRMRPPVGWGAVTGGGTIAGIGFTVSLLIATLAFSGQRLDEAKIGVLSAVVFAMLSTSAVALVTARLPEARRARALLGTAQSVVDLAEPVDPGRDHVRGAAGRAGDGGGVRRLRVPVLRAGRERGARAARGLRRRALRVAAPAADRRAPARAARRGGGGGGGDAGRVLGDARSC